MFRFSFWIQARIRQRHKKKTFFPLFFFIYLYITAKGCSDNGSGGGYRCHCHQHKRTNSNEKKNDEKKCEEIFVKNAKRCVQYSYAHSTQSARTFIRVQFDITFLFVLLFCSSSMNEWHRRTPAQNAMFNVQCMVHTMRYTMRCQTKRKSLSFPFRMIVCRIVVFV